MNLIAVLTEATEAHQSVIQNMARFYVYEMSKHCEWPIPDDGLFECRDFSQYIFEKDRFAFLIHVQNELAGFVLINKVGTSPEVDWNIGEFFILGKFQKKGIGKEVAIQIFDQYPGIWEVTQMPKNTPAILFWKKVVQEYSSGQFKENLQIVKNPDPCPMIILRFESNKKNNTLLK